MIVHPTGKKVAKWDGVQFVQEDETVHFMSTDQRDKAIAKDPTIAKVQGVPATED